MIFRPVYDSLFIMEKKTSAKKDYFWNTLAGLINAAEAVIMSMIITRITGLTDAGYVTIAFAVGNLLLTVGKYGVYSFQVTDHNAEYSFITYLRIRVITTIVMIICLALYILYGSACLSYSHDKILIIMFIGLIYAVESFEDLIKAQLQYIGLLYIGAIMFIVRWCTILISFGIALYFTRSTSTSLGISFILSIIVFIICYIYANRILDSNHNNNIIETDKCYDLLKACYPLFLSMFLSFYIVNASKYAIERYMDAEAQACFGFVAMPVFAIELLNSFIYQPQLVAMTTDYNEG